MNAAIVSQVTGPAFTLMTDERKPQILACGGVRCLGVGEAWAVFNQDFLKESPLLVLRTAREVLRKSIEDERLYRVYATATVDKPAWFKKLGFVRAENIFVR